MTLWTVAHQVPLSREFSKQEYWSGLPFPASGDLPNLGIEPTSHYVSCIGRQVLYHSQTPSLSLPYLFLHCNHKFGFFFFFFLVHKFVFDICKSFYFINKFVLFFKIPHINDII